MVLSKSQKFEIAKKKEYTPIAELSEQYGVSKSTISRALRFVKDSKDGLVAGEESPRQTEELELSTSPLSSEQNEPTELTEAALERFELNEAANAPEAIPPPAPAEDTISVAEFQPTDNSGSTFEQVLNPVIEEDFLDDISESGDKMADMSGEEAERFVDELLLEPPAPEPVTQDVDIDQLMKNLDAQPMDVEEHQPEQPLPKRKSPPVDDEHISLVNEVIQYLNEFEEHLEDVYMGQSKKVFVKSLVKKQPYELKLLLSQIKSSINQKNTQAMMSTAFSSAISATEYVGCEYVGLKINGLSDLFNKNRMVKSQVNLCFKELSIKHTKAIQESGVLEPEFKLAVIVGGAIMNLHTQNSLNSGLTGFKQQSVPKEMVDKYDDI